LVVQGCLKKPAVTNNPGDRFGFVKKMHQLGSTTMSGSRYNDWLGGTD